MTYCTLLQGFFREIGRTASLPFNEKNRLLFSLRRAVKLSKFSQDTSSPYFIIRDILSQLFKKLLSYGKLLEVLPLLQGALMSDKGKVHVF